MPKNLLRQKHVKFLRRSLDLLPQSYEQLDTTRLTLLYFILSGLDILDSLDEISVARKREIIDWIYSHQGPGNSPSTSGFTSSFVYHPDNGSEILYNVGSLPMTYSALACLTILGDDFSRLKKDVLSNHIRSCQIDDGSFCGCVTGSENDMRFVYCAVISSYLLGNEKCFDEPKLLQYIRSCFNHDGGFGQTPGCESHGGSTYCAVASLKVIGKLYDGDVLCASDIQKLQRWCVLRQNEGFSGRPNKPDDSCYTFWIGACLKLLNGTSFVDTNKIIDFTLSTQDAVTGGFGKYPEVDADILHTYLSISGLSILECQNLTPVDPATNLTTRAIRSRSFLDDVKSDFVPIE